MILRKLQQGTGRQLYLLLNGWSASPELFVGWPFPADADVWVVSDYRELSFPEDLDAFEERHLVAWSLGVWVASALWGERQSFTSTLAINGTPFPIHAEWGIPPAIFEGTLNHLDEEGLCRFDRRMCGDRATLQRYQQFPARPVEQKAEELRALREAIGRAPMDPCRMAVFWQKALICQGDRIFPVANQQAYWTGRAEVVTLDAPHLPFFHPEFQQALWR